MGVVAGGRGILPADWATDGLLINTGGVSTDEIGTTACFRSRLGALAICGAACELFANASASGGGFTAEGVLSELTAGTVAALLCLLSGGLPAFPATMR
jgi:hypothetical protein